MHIKRASALAGLVATAVLLAGCATSTPSPKAPASSSSPSASSDAAGTTDAVDALRLTGPTQARTVPDQTPVVDDASPTLPATVTDAAGTRITVTSADRVIALDLYGTLTDTVIGLGLADHLVGRAMSDTQKDLADLPVVSTDGVSLNIEAMLALHPDLVLTNTTIGSAADYRQLESAGVTVVRFDQVPHLDGIADEITAVGAALGVGASADRLAQHTADRLDEATARIAALRAATPREPRAAVLYVRGTGGVFFILGADYGASDILTTLGLDDVAADNGITSLKPAGAEALVSLDPEIILAMTDGVRSAGGVDALLKRPGVAATTAGEHRRIVTAADGQLLSYGPRTPDNLIALAEAIYTDAS